MPPPSQTPTTQISSQTPHSSLITQIHPHPQIQQLPPFNNILQQVRFQAPLFEPNQQQQLFNQPTYSSLLDDINNLILNNFFNPTLKPQSSSSINIHERIAQSTLKGILQSFNNYLIMSSTLTGKRGLPKFDKRVIESIKNCVLVQHCGTESDWLASLVGSRPC